eukprot:GFUD01015658.1.p1 GENE.GFUD01015658.1~~GFUD01015658.1.p1  ORF type:complete len:549 (-),score=167.46 GFUD01015658.1:69-1715(-)
MALSDPSGPVSLRWHQFSTNLGTTSSLLREKNILTDITFVVEEKQVAAHKFILASSSPLFLSLLNSSTHPHPLVFLRGVSFRDLTSLLDFMYQGEVRVEQKHLESFLNTAEELKVKGLSDSAVNDDEGVVENSEGDKDETVDTCMDDHNDTHRVEESVNEKKSNECLKKSGEFKNEAPFFSESIPTECPSSDLNTSSSSQQTCKSILANTEPDLSKVSPGIGSTSNNAGMRRPWTRKSKQIPGKARSENLPEVKTSVKLDKKKQLKQLKSPIEELPSLSAKRTSIYGKQQTEKWKTLSKKNSSELMEKSNGENCLKRTSTLNSSESKKQKSSIEDDLNTSYSKQPPRSNRFEADLPEVSEKQKATSASLETAIKVTKEEIKMLEDRADEDDLPSLADATDGTIAEVEEVLRLSQEVLGDFQCADYPDEDEDVSLDSDEEASVLSQSVSQIEQSVSKLMSSPRIVSSKLNSTKSDFQYEAISSNDIGNILTPVKKYQPSDKNKSVISLMVVKHSSSTTPWKCSICKKLFKTESSAEAHIGLEHVEGKLQ